MDAESLRILRAIVDAAINNPLGTFSVIAFFVGAKAHTLFQHQYPRVASVMFKVMWVGGLAFVYAVTQAYGTGKAVRHAAEAVPTAVVPASPRAGSAGTSGAGGTLAPRGGSGSGSVSPPSAEANAAPAAPAASGVAAAASEPERSVPVSWIADGELSDEITTGDHSCVEEGCRPTRETYRLVLQASDIERLISPRLQCVEGPCAAGAENYTRVSFDQRSVEASFEVWGAPTRWRLSAIRERQILSADRD